MTKYLLALILVFYSGGYLSGQCTNRPNPSFSVPPGSPCSGVPIAFTSNVTGGTGPYTYSWSFGGGVTSTLPNPSQALTSLGCANGSVAVTLTVTDANGCTGAVTNNIPVKQAPDVQVRDQDGISPFSNCENSPSPANPNFTLTITNSSPSVGCITAYSLNWGDGSPVVANPVFPLTHTYTQIGAFNLVVSATGSNGCSNSRTYVVANQSNPAGSLGTLGSTTNLCAPATVPFTISNWELNSVGTRYVLNFGDGTSTTLNHPLNSTGTPYTVNHTYTQSSCPSFSFTASLNVNNACGSTPYSAGNIQIRIKPDASFDAFPTSACVNQSICFNNTSTQGSGVGCLPPSSVWDFGDPASGANNTSTSSSACHTYTTPGNYTVKLTNTNICGSASATKTICVSTPTTAGFTLDNNSICGAGTVTTTNTSVAGSCAGLTYQWDVIYNPGFCGATSSWLFAGGTNANSTSPKFSFTAPGTYTIRLTAISSCGNQVVQKDVTVKKAPTATINPIINSCGQTNICPTSTVINCGAQALTYAWTFNGGNPSTANIANPACVSFATPGLHDIVLAVTNECGTSTTTQTFNNNVAPTLTVPASATFCGGDNTGPFAFTSSGAISWTNNSPSIGLAASGTGDIPSFVATNNTGSAITATITVQAGANGCFTTKTFTIRVNPQPPIPAVTPVINYCNNDPAAPLTATPLPGNTILWYTNAAGGAGSGTAPTVSTATVGTTIYYVSQKNTTTGCESNRVGIVVNVGTRPAVPTVTNNSPLCQGNTLQLTASSSTPGAGYAWIGPAGFTSSIATPSINNVQLANAGNYSVAASLNGCLSQSAQTTVTVNPRPLAPTVSANLSFCLDDDIKLTAATTFAGALSWSWIGPNGFTSTDQNPVIPTSTMAMAGTYNVTATATTGSCASPASSSTVTILPVPVITDQSFVNPIGCNGATGAILLYGLQSGFTYTVQYVKDGGALITTSRAANPDGSVVLTGLQAGTYTNVAVTTNSCISNVVGPFVLTGTAPFSVLAESNGPICEGNTLLLSASATAAGSAIYAWTGPNGFTSADQNPIIPNASGTNSGVYNVTITINGCSASKQITATVSTTTVGGQTNDDASVCNGKNKGTLTLSNYNGSIVRWESSINNGQSWSTIINTSPFLNYNNITVNTWYRAVVQNSPCNIAYSDTTIISVINSVQSVSFPPVEVATCNHDTTITFNATAIYSGTDPITYYWYVNGSVQGNTTMFTYQFRSEDDSRNPEQFVVRVLAENTAGCGDTSLPGIVTINSYPYPDIVVSPSLVQKEPHFTFNFKDLQPSSPNKSFTWYMGDGSTIPKSGQEVNYEYKNLGSWKVNLYVIDRATGCTGADSVNVTVLPVPGSLYIPNAFYPNSAQPELRTFKLQGRGMSKYHLQIFDSWGKVVFETKELNPDGSPKVGWNGNYMNTGKPLPQDAYVWKIVEIEFENGKKWNGMSYNGGPPKYFGNVTLFR